RVESTRDAAVAHQPSVGDHGEASGHRGDELPGFLVRGPAEGGDPARVAVGAAAAVHLLRAMRPARLCLKEVESPPLLHLAVVVHYEPHGVAEPGGPGE